MNNHKFIILGLISHVDFGITTAHIHAMEFRESNLCVIVDEIENAEQKLEKIRKEIDFLKFDIEDIKLSDYEYYREDEIEYPPPDKETYMQERHLQCIGNGVMIAYHFGYSKTIWV